MPLNLFSFILEANATKSLKCASFKFVPHFTFIGLFIAIVGVCGYKLENV